MVTQTDPRVDKYIAQCSPLAQERMKMLRKIIRRTFPTAIIEQVLANHYIQSIK